MPPQTQNVIYLPPGVIAPQPVMQPPPGSGIPFDRAFFEQLLPQAIGAFCSQVTCDSPIVEVLTVDGTTHYVKGISGVSDSWVALHTQKREHEHPAEAFVPYQTVFRVEIHPCSDERPRRLGFSGTFPKPADRAKPAELPAGQGDSTTPAAARKRTRTVHP